MVVALISPAEGNTLALPQASDAVKEYVTKRMQRNAATTSQTEKDILAQITRNAAAVNA